MLVNVTPEQLVGCRIVDDGHRLVVDCVNRLNRTRSRAESDGEVAGLLPVLEARLAEQFRDEEALLRLMGAPDLARHLAEHRRLLDTLAVIRDAFNRGSEVSGILMLNLVCFLVSHLRGSDAEAFAESAPALERAA